jgi:uncharacterized protein (TIGR00725 family)
VRKPYVAVVGASKATEEEQHLAHTVGALLAGAGAVVLSGGGSGVMAASCEGASRQGGTTVGLLPGDTRAEANPFLSIALPTGLGQLRNGLIVAAADAIIAIGGGWGTLSEIALAMRTGKPVVALHTWDMTSPEPDAAGVVKASTPQQAVRLALTKHG